MESVWTGVARMIAFTNRSTLVSDYQAALMAWAINWQIHRDVSPAWGMTPRPFMFFPKGVIIPASAWEITLFDSAGQASYLGFHSLTPAPESLPYGRVFCDGVLGSGGTILEGANSIAAVASHEGIETFVDEDINLYASDYAVEIGDPVEQDAYPITYGDVSVSVSVSNFVHREWFNPTPRAGARFDQMGRCSAPFQMTSGGYVIKLVNGVATQVNARTGTPNLARHNPEHPASRTFKRLHRIQKPA